MRSFATARQLLLALALSWIAGVCLPISAAADNPPQVENIDHYKVYTINGIGSVSSEVQLIDQWANLSHNVSGPRFFGLPANKNNEGIIDALAHYTWYDINSQVASPSRIVVYRNQFGDNTLQTGDARFLLVPARKNQPAPLPFLNKNHYKCYNASGPGPGVQVSLVTQFGTEVVDVSGPQFWCNPADKIHQGQTFPMFNAAAHFVCYNIFPLQTIGQAVQVQDQMLPGQNRQGIVMDNRWLCVPTIQDPPTPAESSTWGKVKAQYRI